MAKEYDVIIIGAGPAGLTAGVYCGRAKLGTLIFERSAVGGQLMVMDVVENYPGFPDGITGFELIERMKKQSEKFGAEFVTGEVIGIEYLASNVKYRITTRGGEEYYAKSIIVATGVSPKKMGIKGETELQGKGVSYCATCDGPLFRDKEVVVIGGGDAAVSEAIYLTRFVKKLTMVHRRDKLRATAILQERLLKNDKVDIKWNSIVLEVLGERKVSGARLKDLNTQKEFEISAQGVFFFVGIEPNTGFLSPVRHCSTYIGANGASNGVKGGVELDKEGFIITDEDMQTSSRGIFACGDARKKSLRQIVTACGEGAQAAFSCQHFIEENS